MGHNFVSHFILVHTCITFVYFEPKWGVDAGDLKRLAKDLHGMPNSSVLGKVDPRGQDPVGPFFSRVKIFTAFVQQV